MRIFVASLAIVAALSSAAFAGGGPENVAVVVNADSWASQAVANEFIHLRRIPPNNVIYLTLGPTHDFGTVDVDFFRQKVLAPTLATIKERGLAAQIDYVIYSTDLPNSVNFASDMPDRNRNYSTASATGLTYLYQRVLDKNVEYVSFRANRYARVPGQIHTTDRPWIRGPVPGANASLDNPRSPPALGFRSSQAWTPGSEPDPTGKGDRYLLSTMLAWTSGRGNSVTEALDCLRRAASADGTVPKGTVYYIENEDIRSTTRQPGFAAAVEDLKALKVDAEIFKTKGGGMPEKKTVAGMMAGIMYFSFASSGSTLEPGAIAEHLTSFGGVLDEYCDHTPMTEWIRCGAAGTSGTVTEPYAIQAKFPMPNMHVHYARGCSLAEAFYQSLMGPYQLLILGDPLCRPWAKIPQVTIEGLPADPAEGTLAITPALKNDMKLLHWELFVDGLRTATVATNEKFTLNTPELPDGYHDVRVVAVTADPVQTQGESIGAIFVNNGKHKVSSRPVGEAKIDYGQTAKVQAAVSGAKTLLLMHNGRQIDTAQGADATFTVDSRLLGTGQTQVQAVGILDDKNVAASKVNCPPVTLTIQPPPPLAAAKVDAAKLANGPALSIAGAAAVTLDDKDPNKYRLREQWLKQAGAKPGQKLELAGYVEAADDDMHQFQVYTDGQCELTLDGQTLKPASAGKGWQFLPVNLKKGPHQLTARITTGPNLTCNIRFGGKGTQTLEPKTFRHLKD